MARDADVIRALADLVAPDGPTDAPTGATDKVAGALHAWLPLWRERLEREPMASADRRALMNSANPVYIPRNHRIEEAIRAAVDDDNFGPFHRLLERLALPEVDLVAHHHDGQRVVVVDALRTQLLVRLLEGDLAALRHAVRERDDAETHAVEHVVVGHIVHLSELVLGLEELQF